MYRLQIFIVSFIFTSQTSAACYWLNGTSADAVEDNRIRRPCKNTGANSMCCFLEGTSTPDTCTPEGLCLPSDNFNLWRDTCTDATWQDPACLQLCTRGQNQAGLDFADLRMIIVTCADGSYCCAAGQVRDQACCREHNGVYVRNGQVVSSLASSFPTSTTTPSSVAASSQSSSQAPSTSRPTTSAPNSATSNTGPIVGGVVGGMAAITTLALAFWYFILRRKSVRLQSELGKHQQQEEVQTERRNLWRDPQEIHAHDPRSELDSGQRQELGVFQPGEVNPDVVRRELDSRQMQQLGSQRSHYR